MMSFLFLHFVFCLFSKSFCNGIKEEEERKGKVLMLEKTLIIHIRKYNKNENTTRISNRGFFVLISWQRNL